MNCRETRAFSRLAHDVRQTEKALTVSLHFHQVRLLLTRPLCANDNPSPFWAFHDRLVADHGWITCQMASGHDFINQVPEEALTVILEAAALP